MKHVSRRSFLKLIAAVAVLVVCASILFHCIADRFLVPLQFDPAAIGEETARALDEAQLKVVYTANQEILNNEILAAVKHAVRTVDVLSNLNVSDYVILTMDPVPDTTEGQYSTILYVTFTRAML